MSSDRAAWMRAVGATEASWSPDGTLTSLKLGPEPIVATDDDDEVPVKRRSAEAQAIALRAERRRVSLGASGGPVRRVSED